MWNIRRRWEDNIKKDIKEIGFGYLRLFQLVQDGNCQLLRRELVLTNYSDSV
jgi:hypothetical protein